MARQLFTISLVLFLGTLMPVSADEAAERAIALQNVGELQGRMARGELSSERLTRLYLERIDRLNDELNAVIAVRPDAVEQARALDAERARGAIRGPLHGMPVIVKDNIETRGMPTTAGSLALAGNDTGRDAPLVAKLRESGAVILGKANLSEWANFRSERSSSGWSAVGGQTRNPHDTTRSPCGSSSGSAVVVAAGLAAGSVGTETNGSVVCPASANGVVGIKPTVGLVSRTHIVPISHSQDTAGAMGRSVRDAVLVFDAMRGHDQADPATRRTREVKDWNLTDHLDDDGLEGKRIGVVRSLAGFHSRVDERFEQAIERMKAEGATIVDDLSLDRPDGFSGDTYEVLLYEFRNDLNRYLAGLPDDELSGLTLEKLIRFNEEHADREMRWFGQEIFHKAVEKGSLESKEYRDALERVQAATRENGIDRLVKAHELDALIAPTGAPAWKIDRVNGDHFIGGSSTFPAVAGYPNITVPMGRVHGLPVGLSIFGPALSEPALIEIAHGYEQAAVHDLSPEERGSDSGA